MAVSDLTAQLPYQALASQANAFSGFGGNPAAAASNLGPAYAGNYNAALNLNQGILQGTQTGYQNLRTQLDQQYGDISKGYANLYGDVLGRIAGTNQTNLTDINSAYDAQAGNQMQSAVSRGLGNSTVQQNMQRGVEMDRQRALTASQNQFAQLGAGYASSLGAQGLQSQQAGAQTQANLGSQQLQFLGNTQAPYPNAGLYSQMAQQYGAQIEANKNRAQVQSMMGGGRFATAGGGYGGGVGTGSGNNSPFLGPRGDYGSGGFLGGQQSFPVGQNQSNGVFDQGSIDRLFNQGQDQSQLGGDFGGGAFSDPQAMAAVGGGAVGALGWGGYGGVGGSVASGLSDDTNGL